MSRREIGKMCKREKEVRRPTKSTDKPAIPAIPAISCYTCSMVSDKEYTFER